MYRSHVEDMAPISLVVGHQQKIGFAPTASMAALGEKLGTDPWMGQLTCCELCQESFFSEAMAQLNSIDGYTKGRYALAA
jgi:hypothetical protein